MPFTSSSAAGSIESATNSVSPTLSNLLSLTASSTYVPSTLITLVSPTASSTPVLTSITSSTSGTTTPTTTGLPSRIPLEISIDGAVYIYEGCIEGSYIQDVTGSYTVGDVTQCGELCHGSTYFQLERGDECKWSAVLGAECDK